MGGCISWWIMTRVSADLCRGRDCPYCVCSEKTCCNTQVLKQRFAFCLFVVLEKDFDRVPREVIRFALSRLICNFI